MSDIKESVKIQEPPLIKSLRKEAKKAFEKFDKAQADYGRIVKMAEAAGYDIQKGELIKFA